MTAGVATGRGMAIVLVIILVIGAISEVRGIWRGR